MSLLAELKRRNVFSVTAAYLVVGWLLTEVFTAVLETLGAPDWTTRGVILAFAFGFIPTVVLSWIYQITPEGIKRDSDIRNEADMRVKSRTFDYLVIASVVILTVTLAFLGSQSSISEKSESSSAVNNASVAVLPFVNMSKDKSEDYFSDGLTETLLHMLAQIPDLKVAARTSSFAFKGKNLNIREIAEALQVAHILEGSVQRSGDKVRITAQLIRADDGFHVWSSIYDRTFDDIFAIQDEIAEKVGSELSQTILGRTAVDVSTGVGTVSTDAYELYLQALAGRATYSFRGLQASENLLKGALAIDPNYLDAKTELANNYLHQFETGLIEKSEASSQILAMTGQVLEARPDDPAATAIQLYMQTQDVSMGTASAKLLDAIAQLESLVADDPADYQIRALLGRLLRNAGQLDRALEILLEALPNDHLNPQILFDLGSVYFHLNRFEDARKSLEKSLEIESQQPNALISLARISSRNGDAVNFVHRMLQALTIDPQDHEIPGFVALFLYRLGLHEEADDFRDLVFAIAPTKDIAYRIELTRAATAGNESASVASARRAIEDDIGGRQLSYSGAVQHLLRVAARHGTVAEESAWLDQHAPGILNVDQNPAPVKFRLSQIAALDSWYTTLPKEELSRRIDLLQEIGDGLGFDPFDDPGLRMSVLAMLGETEEAIRVGLESVFSESVLMHLGWEEASALPMFDELGQDVRVQDALQRWESEQVEQKALVKRYLADLSAAP
jgi:TolB-like protein/Flp pilus assembly protein TadD